MEWQPESEPVLDIYFQLRNIQNATRTTVTEKKLHSGVVRGFRDVFFRLP